MKILTKKKQEENLKRLTALQIILRESIPLENFECYDKAIEHLYDIATDIGGVAGMDKVHYSASAYIARKNLCNKVKSELSEMNENVH